jgi:hypothetical protein
MKPARVNLLTEAVLFAALGLVHCSSSATNTNSTGVSGHAGTGAKASGGATSATGGSTGPRGIAPAATGHIGDPCLPVDELSPRFSGFSRSEIMYEESLVKPEGCTSLQCAVPTRPAESSCLEGECFVYHFQGRTSCPYGQDESDLSAGPGPCLLPGTDISVAVIVEAQLLKRRAADTVYCSCLCGDANGPFSGDQYCQCPDGFVCTPMNTGGGFTAGMAGSFCVKAGTEYKTSADTASCDRDLANCD